ncbi:hypothetical protein [Thalassotalea atypica]|uniref:hypothetical protein n=1 Tax=Thalassotalea atypica TaxID=2054316 RepID=UPI0025736D8A|nr:hypothetical protein [Thalassotalea atypica]
MTIKNEHLFRSLVCIPPVAFFVLLAQNSVMSSGLVLFQVIFTLIALYFTLTSLAHAAHYTNERYEGKAERLFEDKNLSYALTFSLLAIIFVYFAGIAISSSSHIVFQGILVLMASLLVLGALANAAFYTNNYHAVKAEH